MKKPLLVKAEESSFDIIQKSLEKHGINYISDLGLRYFYKDGSSYGFCSNSIWTEHKQKLGFTNLSAMFYSNELLRLKRNNYSHAIRVQGQCHHEFLKQISNNGLGNVLVLYIFGQNKITGFYFLVRAEDKEAVNKFHNDKNIFEKIVRDVREETETIERIECLKDHATPLLSKHTTDELFPHSSKNLIFRTKDGRKVTLTSKQSKILEHFSQGHQRSKIIASLLGVTPKQVDKHIGSLKSIFCVNGRDQLVNIAQEL